MCFLLQADHHGDVGGGALQFILTQCLTSNHHFSSPCCLFNCLWAGTCPACASVSLCFCVSVHVCICACVYVCFTVYAPSLSRAPLLSLPMSHRPHPQHSQASLYTRSLRWWKRMGLLGSSATLKGCQRPSLLGRRTRYQWLRSLGECPIGEWGVGGPERALG